MSDFCAVAAIVLFFLTPLLFFGSILTIIIRAILKKRIKPFIVGCLITFPSLFVLFILLMIIGTFSDPMVRCNHELEIIEDIESTCIEQGKIVEYCSICDGNKVTYKNKSNHLYQVYDTIESTCTEKGKDVLRCTVCGKEKLEYKDMFAHNWVVTSEIESTCTEKGKTISKCALCGDEKTEYADVFLHKWAFDSAIEPTCTVDGLKIEKCELCGETQKQNGEKALGHNLKEISKLVPTYTFEGSVEYSCDRCGHTERVILDKIPESEEMQYNIGETVAAKSFNLSVLSADEIKSTNMFIQPDTGNVYLLIKVLLENTSERDLNISSLLHFDAYVDDMAVNMEIFSPSDEKSLDGTVAPGKKILGALCYQVPKNWSKFELSVSGITFSSKDSFSLAIKNN